MPDPMTPLTAMAVSPGNPTTRSSRGGAGPVELAGPLMLLDVVQNGKGGAAEDPLLLLFRDRERLYRRHRAVDRPEQVRVVAAHHHVARTDEVARHAQRVRVEGHRVVVEPLQV